jgi:two-component system response regulator HydG
MVVQDQDGVLNLDDLQEGDGLRKQTSGDHAGDGPAGLVGRPLNEVERYYIEKTLEKTEGNREEAAKLLGIGERTLYRNIQDWKVQDKIKEALAETGANVEEAAKKLGMSLTVLERKMKKLGMDSTGDAGEPGA